MPGAIFLACVRAWACGVCQSDALTLLYTLVCVALRACKEQKLPQHPLLEVTWTTEITIPGGKFER